MKKNWKLVAVGAACLAIGAVGTAGAAQLITGSDIKDGSIGPKDLSKKAKKGLKGATGPAGAQGPKGDAGINGAPGGPGTSGSTAPALILGNTSPAANATRFGLPIGQLTTGNEALAQVPVPPGTGLLARDLQASVSVAPGGAQSIEVFFRINGVDTGLGCTITGAATSCQAPSATTAALPAGALMSMRATASATANVGMASWGFRVVF